MAEEFELDTSPFIYDGSQPLKLADHPNEIPLLYSGKKDFGKKLDALRDCVEALPDSYREPVELHYREDLPVATIASRLDHGLEAVKKRLQRARQRLLDCINRKLGAAEA